MREQLERRSQRALEEIKRVTPRGGHSVLSAFDVVSASSRAYRVQVRSRTELRFSKAVYNAGVAQAIQGTLIEQLRRDQMHSRDIAAVLESLRRRLAEEGIPFAVIGALALRYYGYVRHTEDIGILTTPEGLDRIHAALVGQGLAPRGPGLRKSLRETDHQVDIDIVTAGEHAGSSESPVEYPPPDSAAFVDVGGLRLPTLEALVEFKIASGVWGHRAQDLADVQRLIRINGLQEAFAACLAPALREKFLDLLREAGLERDLE